METEKRNKNIAFVAAVCILAGILCGMIISRYNTSRQIRSILTSMSLPESDKVGQTISLIESKYVDHISRDSIEENLMQHIFDKLDPHSVYIPAQDLGPATENLEGEFDGIGVVFNMATDTVIILNVIPYGPSDKAGVKAGDRIIMVGDSTIAGRKVPQDGVVKMLRGKRGTKLSVRVERQEIDGLVPIDIVRDKIPVKSIDAAFMITDSIAYVKLSAFSRNSHQELLKALSRLKDEGMHALIFDLRGNSGGFYDQALLLANEFLLPDQLIVYTEDRDGHQSREYSNGRGHYSDLQMAILIDEWSASSSEILAGAMQDNDRATIIGRRSFGKGLVQSQIPFNDGSAIRLTVARYFTPTGRSIQKPYDKDSNYNEDVLNRYAHQEFFSADSIHLADSLRFTTPKGKVVYGGGGIMPDIFVPLDTTQLTRYYLEVAGRNILYRYTIQWADAHRKALSAVATTSGLKALLDKQTDMLDDFVAYARRNGIEPNYKEIAISRELIQSQLRAYIGRNTILEDAGFYSNSYVSDRTLRRAIEELSD